ncbi:MAG: hypothetical protein WCP93_01110 [Candidatus Berkelbacteria bacterium]
MRILTIWLVFLFSFLAFAQENKNISELDQAVVSPALNHVMAKIARTVLAGQQLFISYDTGATWERITWFSDDNGQAVYFSWSPGGKLLILMDFISCHDEIDQSYKHDYGGPGTLGIFDPVEKNIHWIAGFCAKPVKGTDDVPEAEWLDGDTISYKLIRWPNPHLSQEYQKSYKVTPEILAKAYSDPAPKLIHMGWQIIDIVKKDGDPVKFLTEQKVKCGTATKKYFTNKKYRKNIANWFEPKIEVAGVVGDRLSSGKTNMNLSLTEALLFDFDNLYNVIGKDNPTRSCSITYDQKQNSLECIPEDWGNDTGE